MWRCRYYASGPDDGGKGPPNKESQWPVQAGKGEKLPSPRSPQKERSPPCQWLKLKDFISTQAGIYYPFVLLASLEANVERMFSKSTRLLLSFSSEKDAVLDNVPWVSYDLK